MKSLNLIFDETRRQLQIQLNAIESIDGKIGIIIGFTGVILGIVASTDKSKVSCPILFGLGIFLLVVSLTAGI